MAYYNNKTEYFGGVLTLYQSDLDVSAPNAKVHNKPKWYMRVQLKGMKGRSLLRSTKLTVFEEAYEYAKEEYLHFTLCNSFRAYVRRVQVCTALK
jgi:hypothetical protein